MASVVKSFAIDGIDGYPVDIETKTLEGQLMISIIGLGDQAVKEASERVQAAIDETKDRVLDFADVKGQKELIDAVILAAVGGHNMLMIGEPGCGKTMIAQKIPTILPEMTEEECLEVTKIYSIYLHVVVSKVEAQPLILVLEI